MTLGVFYSWNISNKFKLQGLRFGLTDFVMKHYWQILFLASLLEIKKKTASEMHVHRGDHRLSTSLLVVY